VASSSAAHASRRRSLAPEVVQTSPMDCGPASLKCLLEGFGIPVAYGRLREAVQTEVDGTSIDALAQTARALGLDAGQVLVPVDHVGHPLAPTLPGIAVVRLPSGANHFAVAWRRVGSFVQVMDPASGRHWLRVDEFRKKLYVHGTRIPAAAWRRFAGAPHALLVLRHELERLGHPRAGERCARRAGSGGEGRRSRSSTRSTRRRAGTIPRSTSRSRPRTGPRVPRARSRTARPRSSSAAR
jgi:peptidase C39-like protein